MKKLLSIFLAFSLLTLCLFITSCERAEPDCTVFSNKFYAGHRNIYFNMLDNNIRNAFFDSPGEIYYACTDPLCDHSDSKCPGHFEYIFTTVVANPNDRILPLVYVISRRDAKVYVDGEYVTDVDLLRQCAITEFDTATGQSRFITYTDMRGIRDAWYCGGMLYFWADDCISPACRVCTVDVETGGLSYMEIDSNARIIGFYGERIYTITDKGIVYSCALDLGDLREEYDIGSGAPREHQYFPGAYVDDGMLYFERNCRTALEREEGSNYVVSDVYAVRLGDTGAGEMLVANDVLTFKPWQGNLYYTVWDYEVFDTVRIEASWAENGYYDHDICSTDGGAVFRYDCERRESDKLFSNSGVNLYEIYDISDGYIIFSGNQYLDRDTGEVTDQYIYMCFCDIKTGEWNIICQSPMDILE